MLASMYRGRSASGNKAAFSVMWILLLLSLSLWKLSLSLWKLSRAESTTTTTTPMTVIYVSPTGSDENNGTAEAPLATLQGARNVVRKLDRSAPIVVEFEEGLYEFDQAVEMDHGDSGTAECPIVYRAAPGGGQVRWSGGKRVVGWEPVSDPAILRRLRRRARTHVRVANLWAQGLRDLGKVGTRGQGGAGLLNPVPEPELFWNDVALVPARWPNARRRTAKKDRFRGVVAKTDAQHVVVDTGRLRRWVQESDPWIFAYWCHSWSDLGEPIAGLNATARTIIRSKDITPLYGIDPAKARWYAYNLLSELDVPGEYYIDRAHGLAYMWPYNKNKKQAREDDNPVLSQAESLVVGTNVSYVRFEGIVMEAFRREAMDLRGGSHVHIIGCTIRNMGRRGIAITEATDGLVYGCDLYNIGGHAMELGGGNRATLTPGRHTAENNHVYRWSRRDRTYRAAVYLRGVGHYVAHNLLHDAPDSALLAVGNLHILEYNEVHHVLQETGDAGAFYAGEDWTGRGTQIRFNYFHDMVAGGGEGQGSAMAVYLDDQWSGTTVRGNIFEACQRAAYVGGGVDNVVENNVFCDSWVSALHLDNRGMTWQAKDTRDFNGVLQTRLRSVPYQDEPWASRFPHLVPLLQDDPGTPKRNVFRRNISAGGTFNDLAVPEKVLALQTVENNLAFDEEPDWIQLIKNETTHELIAIHFQNETAVHAIGFVPLNVSKIGPYPDPWRATWPILPQEEEEEEEEEMLDKNDDKEYHMAPVGQWTERNVNLLTHDGRAKAAKMVQYK